MGSAHGEHGVGILKRDGMRRELDPGSLALQAAVRLLFVAVSIKSDGPAPRGNPPFGALAVTGLMMVEVDSDTM